MTSEHAHEPDWPQLKLPAGRIELCDERTRSRWVVEIAAFRMAAVPVTRGLVARARGESAPSEAEARLPATDISWLDAVRLCNQLSDAAGLRPCYALGDDPDGWDVTCDPVAGGVRLPSEAEWEYACRAGDRSVRYGELDDIAWHRGNSDERVHAVGRKRANAWGLFDTIGNVWEWCWDHYDTRVYGPYRVFRGGGWFDGPRACRASCRRRSHPTFAIDDLGFRLATRI